MGCVFGPVPSRRLGRSLGVDLVPLKTCTYDCIYCQLGRTTHLTLERREWLPLRDVLAEVRSALATEPDYVTLSGSGEPTLYSRCGELIDGLHAMTDMPVAVLTNGSLLWRPDVRAELRRADLLLPSLDAATEAMFRAVNRPHEGISFERMVDGLAAMREEFDGPYWLEVFLLAGHTAMEAEVSRLARLAERIRPDRVQLNTVTRPASESFAAGVSPERLAELARLFEPPAEVIADFRAVHQQAEFAAGQREVLELLRRRPCRLADVCNGLGLHRNEAVKYLEELGARPHGWGAAHGVIGGESGAPLPDAAHARSRRSPF
jgi:wyosine [tRNA(Phe)-imidazoG37] synthetase (radical SAM superfamily)